MYNVESLTRFRELLAFGQLACRDGSIEELVNLVRVIVRTLFLLVRRIKDLRTIRPPSRKEFPPLTPMPPLTFCYLVYFRTGSGEDPSHSLNF